MRRSMQLRIVTAVWSVSRVGGHQKKKTHFDLGGPRFSDTPMYKSVIHTPLSQVLSAGGAWFLEIPNPGSKKPTFAPKAQWLPPRSVRNHAIARPFCSGTRSHKFWILSKDIGNKFFLLPAEANQR